MGIKIWWQDIMPDGGQVVNELGLGDESQINKAYSNLTSVLKKVARPDTEIEIHHVKRSSFMVNHSYMELLNNVWIVDGIIEAEKQGFDAAIIGCGNDPALQQARQAVDIPVIGPTEAALLIALTLGHKIGIITVTDELVPLLERNIRNYGFEWRVSNPIRVYPLKDDPLESLLELFLEPHIINPVFDTICRECIADGAEVIIPACCALSPATSILNYKEVPDTGVPVIDITQASIKFAEMLIDLKRMTGLQKSQKSWYKSLPPNARDILREMAREQD